MKMRAEIYVDDRCVRCKGSGVRERQIQLSLKMLRLKTLCTCVAIEPAIKRAKAEEGKEGT